MLAKSDGGRLPTGPDVAYEYKLDGFRCCYRVAPDGTTVLTSRNGNDFTDEFAELAGVLAPALGGQAAVLDGEIVVYNEAGQIDFGALQDRRGRYRSHRSRIRAGRVFDDVAVRFLAFDLLKLGRRSLLSAPYDERRGLLAGLEMPDPYRVAVVPAFTFTALDADRRTPQDLLDDVAAVGHEGLMSKRRRARYHPGRRDDAFLKHPLRQRTDVVLSGYRPGRGSLAGRVGGLVLGAHDPDTGDLVYVGDVGTGFSARERSRLQELLDPLQRRTHPFAAAPPRAEVTGVRWVQPRLVGEVEYRQVTRSSGRLRHTSWQGLLDDRAAADVVVPRPRSSRPKNATAPSDTAGRDGGVAAVPSRVTVTAGGRTLVLTNLAKPLYPDGVMKAQVIEYYSRIAPFMLPHLTQRPVSFVRFPDGVGGGQFFEKNVAAGAPDWLPRVSLPRRGSRGTSEQITYPLIEELAALVWSANLAALELHVPQWRIAPGPAPGLPDRLVFDLDPGPGASITECCRVAERLRDILIEDGLTPFPKTSGSKGMQLMIAITTEDPGAPSAYAKRLAQQLTRETPEAVTATMAKAQRTGKVFIDWSQNSASKTTIAPYSLRGREHPTVSTPITWDEVRACRTPTDLVFLADDVLARVQQLGDLLAGLTAESAVLPASTA